MDDLETEEEFHGRLNAIGQKPTTRATHSNPFHLPIRPHLANDLKVTRVTPPNSEPMTCRLCHNSDERAHMIVPCQCRGSVHVSCLNQRRTLSVNKFFLCDVCGWPYDFDKDQLIMRSSDTLESDAADDDDETEECPNRARREVMQYIRGPECCFFAVHLAYIAIAQLLLFVDSNRVLAAWAHADMELFTEIEINYSIAVCLVALLLLVVATVDHGFAMCIYVWIKLPAVIFCICIGSFVDPFTGFVMFGVLMEEMIWSALVRRELQKLIYEWTVRSLRS